MGVQNLWQLLGPTARPTKLQALEGKRLAIDISIWLHQATKGVRGSKNGHVMVLYNRICKLLYFKVKPVFVFDGPNVPRLKARILQERQRRRNVAANKAKELELKIQSNIIESYALQTVLGNSADSQLREKSLQYARSFLRQQNEPKDLFELPEQSRLAEEDDEENVEEEDGVEAVESGGEASDQPSRPPMITSLEDMDQEVFEALPADIKIEILTSYKEKLKSRKSHSYEEFPEQSQDFSQYQMKLLLRKNEVSSRINSIKSAANAEYTADLPFENVFLSKIASEDDREVILLTRKDTNVLRRSPTAQQDPAAADDLMSQLENEKDPALFKSKLEQCLESNLLRQRQQEREQEMLAEEKRLKRKNSDECVIEFDYNNRIRLVNRYQDDDENEKDEEEEVVVTKKPDRAEEDEERPAKRRSMEPGTSASFESPAKETETPKQSQTPATRCAVLTSQLDLNKDAVSDSESDDDFVEVDEAEPELILLDKRPEPEPEKTVEPEPVEKAPLDEESQAKTPEPTSVVEPAPPASKISEELRNYDLAELGAYSESLLAETEAIARERYDQERLSNRIESSVTEDAKALLRLFGLPFVTSPGEAEAQCAYLDLTGQTDGTITEDSDVWLFGGKRVYKNFFGTEQHIDAYSDAAILGQLGLDRESLICIAYLVGSDYAEGIDGVGIVKAVEILQEFEGERLDKLRNFRQWHAAAAAKDAPPPKSLNKLRAQLVRLDVPDDFPNPLVYKAYMEPELDTSRDEFTWGVPELDAIRKFLASKLNWSAKKVDDGLLPVIRRMNEKKIQQPIEAFFSFEALNSAFNKQSKRMQTAIKSLKQKSRSDLGTSSASAEKEDDDLGLSEDEEDRSFNEMVETKSKYFAETKSKKGAKATRAASNSNKKPRKAGKAAAAAKDETSSSESGDSAKRKSPAGSGALKKKKKN